MKKLLIGLCAASMLAASAMGYAGSVTFVNNYDQPVTFVVSKGLVYNPVAGGTVPAGERATLLIDGPFTPDHSFMAFPPLSSISVTGCGKLTMPVENVTVKAGWSEMSGMFGCWLYPTPMYVEHEKHKKTCHGYKHHHRYYMEQ
jgi:hypothetical protein